MYKNTPTVISVIVYNVPWSSTTSTGTRNSTKTASYIDEILSTMSLYWAKTNARPLKPRIQPAHENRNGQTPNLTCARNNPSLQ